MNIMTKTNAYLIKNYTFILVYVISPLDVSISQVSVLPLYCLIKYLQCNY